jgi:hypothetical protein
MILNVILRLISVGIVVFVWMLSGCCQKVEPKTHELTAHERNAFIYQDGQTLHFRNNLNEEFPVTIRIQERFFNYSRKGCDECCGADDNLEVRTIEFESAAHADVFPVLALSSGPNTGVVSVFKSESGLTAGGEFYHDYEAMSVYFNKDMSFNCEWTTCLENPTMSNQTFTSIAKLTTERVNGEEMVYYLTPLIGLLKVERNLYDVNAPSSTSPISTEEHFLVL